MIGVGSGELRSKVTSGEVLRVMGLTKFKGFIGMKEVMDTDTKQVVSGEAMK